MQITAESIESHIPSYLTKEAKEGIAKALAAFPQGANYYTSRHATELLQGDGWTSLALLRFETGETRVVRGILLSNSCDIAPENQRDFPPGIVFAPLISLQRYAELLARTGIDQEKIAAKVTAIREQRVTTVFFLPKGAAGLDDDYIAHLDDLHTLPLPAFLSREDRKKLFTLSQVGFYLFVFKLSIHFCRFHENVLRD